MVEALKIRRPYISGKRCVIYVTPHVMETLNHIVNLQLSPNARTHQTIKVGNRIQIQISNKYLK
jgi:hypothetical protein